MTPVEWSVFVQSYPQGAFLIAWVGIVLPFFVYLYIEETRLK